MLTGFIGGRRSDIYTFIQVKEYKCLKQKPFFSWFVFFYLYFRQFYEDAYFCIIYQFPTSYICFPPSGARIFILLVLACKVFVDMPQRDDNRTSNLFILSFTLFNDLLVGCCRYWLTSTSSFWYWRNFLKLCCETSIPATLIILFYCNKFFLFVSMWISAPLMHLMCD